MWGRMGVDVLGVVQSWAGTSGPAGSVQAGASPLPGACKSMRLSGQHSGTVFNPGLVAPHCFVSQPPNHTQGAGTGRGRTWMDDSSMARSSSACSRSKRESPVRGLQGGKGA